MKIFEKAMALSLTLLSVGVVSTALCAAPVAAQPADPKLELAQDVDAFYKDCPGPPLEYSTQCDNELGQLQRRLQALHLTYEELKAALPSRSGRWQ